MLTEDSCGDVAAMIVFTNFRMDEEQPGLEKGIHMQGHEMLGSGCQYPENLRFSNIAYFLVIPALVYQTSFPVSSRFRGRWMLW